MWYIYLIGDVEWDAVAQWAVVVSAAHLECEAEGEAFWEDRHVEWDSGNDIYG